MTESRIEQPYRDMPFKSCINPGFWTLLKFKLFGEKKSERAGDFVAVFYAYRGVMYLISYKAWYL